jgi:hypothetical protein
LRPTHLDPSNDSRAILFVELGRVSDAHFVPPNVADLGDDIFLIVVFMSFCFIHLLGSSDAMICMDIYPVFFSKPYSIANVQ